MGDADNTFQPSKKRAAGRELSRDNPGLDDEEEVPGQETGTFKRASEEVLANRRIVKVRRSSQPSATPPAAATAAANPFAAIRLVPPPPAAATTPSNPFAGIQLVPPTDSTATSAAVNEERIKKTENDENAPEEGASEVRKPEAEAEKDAEKTEKVEKKVENDENTPEKVENKVENDENAPEEETKSVTQNPELEAEKDSEKTKKVENKAENDENTPGGEETKSVSSFQQLSTTQNAFTGLVGTGFSTSSFSFGSISKTDQQPSFPSFNFGTNGNSSLFGAPPTESTNPEKTKIPSMQTVHVSTGEEDEKAVFTADAALFEFFDGGWKERGKGELKVNVLTTGSRKARLVMRARGNYRLILNASIFPDMKLTNMEKKGITFACVNSGSGEGQSGLSTFALKFKDAAIVDEFRTVVMENKGGGGGVGPGAGLGMKTPENSPKASDE